MKLLKLIFSRFIIVALFFIVQLGLLYFVFFTTFISSLIAQTLTFITCFIVFLVIINKVESPEFKIPWLVLFFVLPFFTAMLYVLLSSPRMKKKESETLKKTYDKIRMEMPEKEKPVSMLEENEGIAQYLYSVSNAGVYSYKNAEYFPTGESFFADYLKSLESANRFIFLEYFIIEKGKMWQSVYEILKRKAKDGIDVRLIYDDMGTLGSVKSSYFKFLRKDGIKCYKFNPFRPVLSGIFNHRDHRKITIIDGRIAYTGGINLADEYINEVRPYGYFKDTAIRIEGDAVIPFTATFLLTYDSLSKTQSNYQELFAPHNNGEENVGYLQPFSDGPKPFYSDMIAQNNFMNVISSAKRYVYITTPYFIVDFSLLTAIINCAKRGVDVRIITPRIPDKKSIHAITRSYYESLVRSGVKVYEYTPGFIHSKTLVCDDEIAFVGTVNFDYRSFVHHFECGVMIYGAPTIQSIKADFISTQNLSEQVTDKNLSMSPFTKLYCSLIKIFTPLL